MSGAFSLTGNGSFSANSFAYTTTFGANDDLNIVKGSHQFAFGAHYLRSIEWSVAQAWSGGSYTITGAVTGLGMSDFFLGNVSQLRQANPNPLNLNQNFFGVYGQDTWKISPKLTLTYSGTTPPGDRPTRVFAQLVDDAQDVVVGNQITPIAVQLDGSSHTIAVLETSHAVTFVIALVGSAAAGGLLWLLSRRVDRVYDEIERLRAEHPSQTD